MEKAGILLINLGTPDAPTPEAVGRYLREFLMDPEVITAPSLIRWFLVHALIVPRRSHASAEAYSKIWTDSGSPLFFHTKNLAQAVQTQLGEGFEVAVGMRYGSPSIEKGLLDLIARGAKPKLVVPLYPQYARATTESSLQALERAKGQLALDLNIPWMKPFYARAEFLDAFARVLKRQLDEIHADFVLFSFHGLPERHIKREDTTRTTCLKAVNCCEQINRNNLNCYRAHCFQTARKLAERLGLPSDRYDVSFQSRLGPTRWIPPYTESFYEVLPRRGVKRLAVASPAFVADCLETLEEIRIRGEESFRKNGGDSLHLLTSLNAEMEWVEALTQMIRADL